MAASNNLRYCAHHFSTKLVVDTILSFGSVADDVPWPAQREEVQNESMPTEMALPVYPPPARMIDYEGVVLVAVTVAAGEVTKAEVQFGDPVLVEEALANVRTWRFSPDVNTSFSVTYEFRFEKRPMNEGRNPVLEMRLPFYLKVTGPSNDW